MARQSSRGALDQGEQHARALRPVVGCMPDVAGLVVVRCSLLEQPLRQQFHLAGRLVEQKVEQLVGRLVEKLVGRLVAQLG